MLENYITRFEKMFDERPNVMDIFRRTAFAYLQNGNERFIIQCEFAHISDAREIVIADSYYQELARACMIAIKRREEA